MWRHRKRKRISWQTACAPRNRKHKLVLGLCGRNTTKSETQKQNEDSLVLKMKRSRVAWSKHDCITLSHSLGSLSLLLKWGPWGLRKTSFLRQNPSHCHPSFHSSLTLFFPLFCSLSLPLSRYICIRGRVCRFIPWNLSARSREIVHASLFLANSSITISRRVNIPTSRIENMSFISKRTKIKKNYKLIGSSFSTGTASHSKNTRSLLPSLYRCV